MTERAPFMDVARNAVLIERGDASSLSERRIRNDHMGVPLWVASDLQFETFCVTIHRNTDGRPCGGMLNRENGYMCWLSVVGTAAAPGGIANRRGPDFLRDVVD